MSHRQERVAREIRDRLAQILEQRVADPRLHDVTVTGVKVSSDLSLARVFFRTLSDSEDRQKAFESAKPFLRRCLGEEMRLRRVPELDFRVDESLDNAQRIEQILREIKEETG